MKHNRVLITTLLVFAIYRGNAQQTQTPDEPVRLGLMAGGTMNIHRGDFTNYDGVLECAAFNNATSPGWFAGYSIELPISRAFSLSGRLGYWKADGGFTTPNPVAVRVAIDSKTIVPLTTEHSLQTSLDYISLDALAKIKIVRSLYLALGPTIGFAARAAYDQSERIISPQGLTFENGETSRKIIAGNFDQQGTQDTRRLLRLAATAALGADIAVGSRFMISPEVGYSYGLTNVLSTFNWKVGQLRAGVSFSYALGGEREPDTVVMHVASPKPVAAFEPRNIATNGVLLDYAAIDVNEERVSDAIPLLPYLFFAPNSSVIADRYLKLSTRTSGEFSEAGSGDSVLDVYHHLLNIIGTRLRKYPEANITVTGCREPRDDSGATNALAEARAVSVKDYLTTVWSISPDRILTASRILPAAVSYREVVDGREENRRAEITSNDPRILAPVFRESVSRDVQPKTIALDPHIQFGDAVAGWKASIANEQGRSVWSQSGTGAPAKTLLWDVADPDISNGTHMNASLEITPKSGSQEKVERSIPIRRTVSSRRFNGSVVHDSLIERYNMIFFDFDTPHISDFNQQIVGLVQSRMRTNSSVNITGLTDRMGDSTHNQSLSVARASAVAKVVRERIVPEKLAAQGAGPLLIYNNDLPEGRMYNRTVIIEVATPLEK